MTLIGVPRESAEGERRVALVPKVVERLCAEGHRVIDCSEQAVVDLLAAALGERLDPVASLCTAVPLAAHEDPQAWAPPRRA